MTTTYHAQPYDNDATGFYFEDKDTYLEKISNITNAHGQAVEEFEIQFIDGEPLDGDLTKAFGLNQANILHFMDAVDEWDDDEKRRYIVAVWNFQQPFEHGKDHPSDLDVIMYQASSLVELAMQFVDEGHYGDISAFMTNYIDYAAMARDLAFDYDMMEIGGERWAVCYS